VVEIFKMVVGASGFELSPERTNHRVVIGGIFTESRKTRLAKDVEFPAIIGGRGEWI
jgi:hypothetical protein